MSPRRTQSRRVNKHAKTLHCECDKSYTRADHFERHKRICRHKSEFIAVSESADSSHSDPRPFYCLCGAGYTAAHAFTRHCRRTGHDGDWLRSTYQPRGHQDVATVFESQIVMDNLVVAAHTASQQQPQVPADNDTHSLPEFRHNGSDDSGLGSSINGDEPGEPSQRLEGGDPVIPNRERDYTVSPEPLIAIPSELSNHSESNGSAAEEASGRYENELVPALETPPTSFHNAFTPNRMEERDLDADISAVPISGGDDIEASPQLIVNDADADHRAHGSHVVPLTEAKVRPTPIVEDQYPRRRTRYLLAELPKNRVSRYSAKKCPGLGSLRASKENRFSISKAHRYGKRFLRLVGQHKGKACALLVAMLGVYATTNRSGHFLTFPAVTSSQDWITDSVALRHTARSSGVLNNIHAALKACPSASIDARCKYSRTFPLKFNDSKYLLSQDVLYTLPADLNVSSPALTPISVRETDWRHSSTGTMAYSPYVSHVGDSVGTRANVISATISELDASAYSEAQHSVSSHSSQSEMSTITTGSSKVNPASAPQPTTKSHHYSPRGTKRSSPESSSDIIEPPAKRFWSEQNNARLKDVLNACGNGIHGASSFLVSWRSPRRPVASGLDGTTQGKTVTGIKPAAPSTTAISSGREGERSQYTISTVVSSASDTTIISNYTESLPDIVKTNSESPFGRTGGWQTPTWPTLWTVHKTQPQPSAIEPNDVPQTTLAAAKGHPAATPSAATPIAINMPALPDTSVPMTAPTGLSHHAASSSSSIATTTATTTRSPRNTSSADWTLSNPFTWRPSPRINARDYTLAKLEAAKKRAKETRDELKQKLEDVQKCPPCEACKSYEPRGKEGKDGEGCWLF